MIKWNWDKTLGCYCAEGNPTIQADANGNVFAGGSTKIEAAQPAPAPSTAEAINAYIKGLPQMYQAQLEYAPKEAAQQVAMAQQYAAPLSQAYYEAQKTLYPEATQMQELLAKQAQEGMAAGLSDPEKQQYQSDLAAQLGTNAGSGIGADYMSRQMLLAQQNRQDYYRNLGLSVAGLQPTAQAQGASYTNQLSQYNPGQVMGFMGQGYGNQVGAQSSMYGSASNLAGQKYASNMNMLGSGIGAMGAMGI
jgi:hypothetical protein